MLKIMFVLQIIPVTSFGLGCWQVYRLQWKLELIDKLQATSSAVPIDMPQEYDLFFKILAFKSHLISLYSLNNSIQNNVSNIYSIMYNKTIHPILGGIDYFFC